MEFSSIQEAMKYAYGYLTDNRLWDFVQCCSVSQFYSDVIVSILMRSEAALRDAFPGSEFETKIAYGQRSVRVRNGNLWFSYDEPVVEEVATA